MDLTVLVIVYAVAGGFLLAKLVDWVGDVVIRRWVQCFMAAFDARYAETPAETSRAEKTLVRPVR
jgi:hypothetical protein